MTRNALRLRSAGPQAESAFGDVGSADRQRLVSYLRARRDSNPQPSDP